MAQLSVPGDVDRGATCLTLGYGEFAVADSYKAHFVNPETEDIDL